MAPPSPDALETLEDDTDHDVRTRKVERLVVAAAIIGPILLGLTTWLLRAELFNPSLPRFFFSGALIGPPITLALTIWLAWRHPILGGRPVRTLVLATVIMSSLIGCQYFQSYRSLAMGQPLLTFILIGQIASFLAGIAVMVFARRVLHVVLVKRSEPQNYRPSRLSIRELMAWTFVIASYLALYHHLMRWIDGSGLAVSRVPGWFSVYFILASYLPMALLVVAVVYCQRFALWWWLPVMLILYPAICFADESIKAVMYRYFVDTNAVYPAPNLHALVGPVTFVLMTVVLVWIFRKCGYEFQRGPQVSLGSCGK